MSRARLIAYKATYLISRRTSERRFFLRPSTKTNQIVRYCLARAAELSGVIVHGYCFNSNHFHLVVTDVRGTLPQFMHWLDEFVAKCMNALLGRNETFWAPGSYSAVSLVDAQAVVSGLVYCFNNPVSSGLVARASDWPGAISTPADMERPPVTIKRPTGFFRNDGPLPEFIELRLAIPESLEITVNELETIVARDESDLRERAAAGGRRFLGRRQILRQSPWGRPVTENQRRGINPRVASKDRWRRVEALRQLKSFLAAYGDALARYVAGDTRVCFPYGTYGMRVRFNVMCHGP